MTESLGLRPAANFYYKLGISLHKSPVPAKVNSPLRRPLWWELDMRKSTIALLFAAFAFGFMTIEADAKIRHWHHHHHHHHRHHHHHHQKHHRRIAEKPIIVAQIDVSSQSMYVSVNGWPYGTWAVSTAGTGYHTPRGSFGVQRLAAVYYSKKYDNSPMPNSVFFTGGIAIHGSYHTRSLGHPASHGCVRLSPQHAAELYALVQEYGPRRTRIVVTD